MKFPSLTIAARLYTIFAVLAAAAIALTAVAIIQARRQAALASEFHSAFVGAQSVQHVNSLIYAVVMESRGIYMSPDVATAKKFGAGLLKFNDEISDVVKDWKQAVRSDDAEVFGQFSDRIQQFQKFRRELVRLAYEVSPAAGREYGDNDANRTVRSALNKDIDTLAKLYDQRSRRLSAEMETNNSALDRWMTILGTVSVLITAFGAFSIWRSVVRPLAIVTSVTETVASGQLDAKIPYSRRKDEVGALARAVKVFRDGAVEKLRLERESAEQRRQADEARQKSAEALAQAADEQRHAAEAQAQAQANIAEEQRKNAEHMAEIADEQSSIVQDLAAALAHVAEGDLTVRLSDRFTGNYAQIKADFDKMAAGLQETITAISRSATDVASAAVEIASATIDLSQRTEQQAAGLEQTSASMEEISAIVKKNAGSAQHANTLASDTCAVADRGGAVVSNAVDAMTRIEESSRKIADIIGVIDEIARQTNLLALNAAVEAARAGDSGRGFAVVATEVRGLAQRSSQAAKDIKELIGKSSQQVKDGVELVRRTGTSLDEIVTSIKGVAGIVSDIATASTEQAAGLDQVNKALTQMDGLTQQNSAFVEENAATAKTLEQHSKAVADRLAGFTVGHGAASAPSPIVARAPKAAAPPPKAARTARPQPTQGALAVKPDAEWQEF